MKKIGKTGPRRGNYERLCMPVDSLKPEVLRRDRKVLLVPLYQRDTSLVGIRLYRLRTPPLTEALRHRHTTNHISSLWIQIQRDVLQPFEEKEALYQSVKTSSKHERSKFLHFTAVSILLSPAGRFNGIRLLLLVRSSIYFATQQYSMFGI